MKVERFDARTDGDLVRACHEIYLSGVPDDDPLGPPMSPRSFAGWLTLGFTEDPQETWLARDGSGEPCAWYVLSLPQRENRHLAPLSLAVHADRRRAGRGTALLRHAAGRARQAGRTVLEMDALEGSPGAAEVQLHQDRRSRRPAFPLEDVSVGGGEQAAPQQRAKDGEVVKARRHVFQKWMKERADSAHECQGADTVRVAQSCGIIFGTVRKKARTPYFGQSGRLKRAKIRERERFFPNTGPSLSGRRRNR